MHPSRLPYLEGPEPYTWIALHPDLYPHLVVTWHYTTREYDQGGIIKPKHLLLAADQSDWLKVKEASNETFLNSAHEALKLVEDGFERIEQRRLATENDIPSETIDNAYFLTDEQRTITSDMSIPQKLHRALAQSPFLPLLQHQSQLYHVHRVTHVSQEDIGSLPAPPWNMARGTTVCTTGAQKRVGLNIFQAFQDGYKV